MDLLFIFTIPIACNGIFTNYVYIRHLLHEDLAFYYVLSAALAFGISNVLWKVPVSTLGVVPSIFFRNVLTSIAFGVWFLISGHTVSATWLEWSWTLCICLLSYTGLYFFNRANKEGQVSVIIPIISTNSMVSALVALVFMGESLSLARALGLIVAFAGVFTLSISQGHKTQGHIQSHWVWYAIITSLCWGVSFSQFGYATRAMGVEFFNFLLELVICLLAGIQFLAGKGHFHMNFHAQKGAFVWILCIALCGVVGVYGTSMGFYLVPVTTVEYINTLSYVFPVAIGYFVYREKISKYKWLGIALIFAGIFVGKMSF